MLDKKGDDVDYKIEGAGSFESFHSLIPALTMACAIVYLVAGLVFKGVEYSPLDVFLAP